MTAELAMAIPILAALTVALAWLLSIGLAQVRAVDAVREAARAAARGDDPTEASRRAGRIAGDATVTVTVADGRAVAVAEGSVSPPGGLLAFLPPAPVSATAVAATEPVPP